MAFGGLLPPFLMLVNAGSMRLRSERSPCVTSIMGMKANGCRPQAVLWQHLRSLAAKCSYCGGRSATTDDLWRLSDEREKRVSGRLVQQLFQPWGSVGPQDDDWPRQARGRQGQCSGPATVLSPKHIDRGVVGQQFRGGWRGIGRVPAQNGAQAPMNTGAIQRGREAEVTVVAVVSQKAAVQDSDAQRHIAPSRV
jgi:hypothetical protein